MTNGGEFRSMTNGGEFRPMTNGGEFRLIENDSYSVTVYGEFEVTAYTLAECGKTPDHPLYGITASGAKVKEGHTIAAPPDIPFGTKIYIPYFDTIFTVEDRGGAIKGDRLDVYMKDVSEALEFGRRRLDVIILTQQGGGAE